MAAREGNISREEKGVDGWQEPTRVNGERKEREKSCRGEGREIRNPPARKVGRGMKIYRQPDTEIYPQEENKIRGKRSLIEERGEIREIKRRRLGLGFCWKTKPEERKPRTRIKLKSNSNK